MVSTIVRYAQPNWRCYRTLLGVYLSCEGLEQKAVARLWPEASSSRVVCAPALLLVVGGPDAPHLLLLGLQSKCQLAAEAARAGSEAREGCSVVAGCRGGRGSPPLQPPPPPPPASTRSPATPPPTCAPTPRPRASSRYRVPGRRLRSSPPRCSPADGTSPRSQSQSLRVAVPRWRRESPGGSPRPPPAPP